MKWNIGTLDISEIQKIIREAEKTVDFWKLPFARFYCQGEPTTYTLLLSFTGAPDRRITIRPSDDCIYRPFTQKTVKRNMGIIISALIEIIWFLENWDYPICKAYREVRGLGGVFKFWFERSNG